MIIRLFIVKSFKLFRDSIVSFHIFNLVVSIIICFLFKDSIDYTHLNESFSDILNGMGVLTAFLILAIDNLDLNIIKEEFFEIKVNMFGNQIPYGKMIINTIYSCTLLIFVALGIQYILLIYNIRILLLLLVLVVYIFVSFLFILSIWHGLELNFK